MNEISFNFIVCKAYHEKRTLPLVDYLDRNMKKHFPDGKYWLLGAESTDLITKVSDSDDYLSGIDKTIGVFRLHDGQEYDWYFIGDDDTFINFENMRKVTSVLSKDDKCVYGHACMANDDRIGVFAHLHGGSGILISRSAFLAIKSFMDAANTLGILRRHNKHGDVTVAMNIIAHNAMFPHSPVKIIDVQGMVSPHIPIDHVNVKNAICIHTKDRVSFDELERRMNA